MLGYSIVCVFLILPYNTLIARAPVRSHSNAGGPPPYNSRLGHQCSGGRQRVKI